MQPGATHTPNQLWQFQLQCSKDKEQEATALHMNQNTAIGEMSRGRTQESTCLSKQELQPATWYTSVKAQAKAWKNKATERRPMCLGTSFTLRTKKEQGKNRHAQEKAISYGTEWHPGTWPRHTAGQQKKNELGEGQTVKEVRWCGIRHHRERRS